jgi:hypothetical protein
MGIDHLREFGAAGKSGGTRKFPESSSATWGFIEQTTETSVKFEDVGNGFDFFQQ